MPRLLAGDMENHKLGGNFSFSGARVSALGASEYTLVTIAIDVTGSVLFFKKQLRDMLITAVESCKKSPRAENLLVRVILFSDCFSNGKGVEEVHGFKPLLEIDTNAYPELDPRGGTPLFDACYSSVAAMNAYAKTLVDQDFGVNGICIIVTDGGDTSSVLSPKDVGDELQKAVSGEVLESLVSILVGINADNCRSYLETFQQGAGLTHYRNAGDATPRNMAKLAGFVSQSVSSQSQALGTGGPSQNIAPTI